MKVQGIKLEKDELEGNIVSFRKKKSFQGHFCLAKEMTVNVLILFYSVDSRGGKQCDQKFW